MRHLRRGVCVLLLCAAVGCAGSGEGTADAGGSGDAGADAGGNGDAGADAGGNGDAGADAGGNGDAGADAGGNGDAGADAGGNGDAGGSADAGADAGGAGDAGAGDAGFHGDAGDPELPITPTVNHWALAFQDDFAGPTGKPSDDYCFNQLKPQCVTWPGGSNDCDYVGDPGVGFAPPIRDNFISVLKLFNPSADYASMSTDAVKSTYGAQITQRLANLDKCTWSVYQGLNWMATDYNGHYAARFDATQVEVDKSGKGTLKLYATAAPVDVHCIYGGTLGGPNCQVKAFAANVLVQGVTYTVDPNPSWPGVYYAQTSGTCPHGGTPFGPNCQVYAFNRYELEETGVTYWADANPAYPGVYYADTAYRCRDNIDYSPDLHFRNLTCPVVNGAIMSMTTDTHGWVDGSGVNHPRGHTQEFGRFEVKLHIPKGLGAFPAAWMMPTGGGWPYDGGEIDILEARDAANETYLTYHNGKCYNPGTMTEIRATDDADCVNNKHGQSLHLSKGFTAKERDANEFWRRDHVFSVEWVGNHLDYFVNDVKVGTIAPGTLGTTDPASASALNNFEDSNFPFRAFYWILNHSTWVPNDKLSGWPQQTHAIDWIKDLTLCTKQKDFCPCGGTFAEGVGCKVPAGFALACPLGLDAPQVTSGVYPSACAPAKHDCVNGGVRVGTQCKVKAYGPNDLPTPGAGYYVDADPRWPGLYYPQVNGACPYGGVSMHGACQVDPYGPTLLETGVDYTVVRSGSTAGVYYSPDFPAP